MMFSRLNFLLAAVLLVALAGTANGRTVARASTVRGLRGEKGFKKVTNRPDNRRLKKNDDVEDEAAVSGDLGGKGEDMEPSTEDVMTSLDSDPSEAPMSVDDAAGASMESSADKVSAPSKKSASSKSASKQKIAKSKSSKDASASGNSVAKKSKKSASGGSSASGSKGMKMSKLSKSKSSGNGGSSGAVSGDGDMGSADAVSGDGEMGSTDAPASVDEEEDMIEEEGPPPTNEDSPLYYPASAIADACENYEPNPDIQVSRCEAVCEAGACCFADEESDNCAACENYEPCEVLYV